MMEKFLAGLFAVALVLGLLCGFYALVWLLWCFVLGAIWPDGPQAIVNPSFWLFVGGWVLISMILKPSVSVSAKAS